MFGGAGCDFNQDIRKWDCRKAKGFKEMFKDNT